MCFGAANTKQKVKGRTAAVECSSAVAVPLRVRGMNGGGGGRGIHDALPILETVRALTVGGVNDGLTGALQDLLASDVLRQQGTGSIKTEAHR